MSKVAPRGDQGRAHLRTPFQDPREGRIFPGRAAVAPDHPLRSLRPVSRPTTRCDAPAR